MAAAEGRLQEKRKEQRKVIMKRANERIAEGVHPLVALQPEDYEW